MVLRQLDALTSELVQKATSGDGAALNQIMTSLSRPFYNLALRMLQNHEAFRIEMTFSICGRSHLQIK